MIDDSNTGFQPHEPSGEEAMRLNRLATTLLGGVAGLGLAHGAHGQTTAGDSAARLFKTADSLNALQTRTALTASLDLYRQALTVWSRAGDRAGESRALAR